MKVILNQTIAKGPDLSGRIRIGCACITKNGRISPTNEALGTIARISTDPVIINRLVCVEDERIALTRINLERIDRQRIGANCVGFNDSLMSYEKMIQRICGDVD